MIISRSYVTLRFDWIGWNLKGCQICKSWFITHKISPMQCCAQSFSVWMWKADHYYFNATFLWHALTNLDINQKMGKDIAKGSSCCLIVCMDAITLCVLIVLSRKEEERKRIFSSVFGKLRIWKFIVSWCPRLPGLPSGTGAI